MDCLSEVIKIAAFADSLGIEVLDFVTTPDTTSVEMVGSQLC